VKRWIGLLALLALAGCGDDVQLQEPPEEEIWEGYGSQVCVLFFAEGALDLRWNEEARAIEILEDPTDRVAAVLAELFAGPGNSDGRAFPARTRLEQIFLEADGTLTLDFSESSARRLLRAGSLEERVALEALRRTLRVNFPEIRRLRLLVGGQSAEALGGHLWTGDLLPLGEGS
jgi:hypothetical protein